MFVQIDVFLKHGLVFILCVLLGSILSLHAQSKSLLKLTANPSQQYCPKTEQPIVTDFNIEGDYEGGITELYIQISSGYVQGKDELKLLGDFDNISALWKVSEAKMTLSSVDDSALAPEDLIRAVKSVVFYSSDPNPTIDRYISITIGMLCLDAQGNLSGSCTTSGLAYKMKGRVGDSPIIGSGLFVDNQVGAATATGLGEAVIKTVGSFLIVELMRNGWSPQKACEEAMQRILSKQAGKPDFQVGFIAINIAGEKGAYSIHKGFSYTYYHSGKAINVPSASVY